MGSEFGQRAEWNHDASPDWHLLQEPEHEGLRACVVGEVGKRGCPEELAAEPAGLQCEPAHGLQIRKSHSGTVCGEKDARLRGGHIKGEQQQFFQVVFRLESAALVASRKSRGIENDRIESFLPLDKPGNHIEDVVCDETVAAHGDGVESEVFGTPLQ